MASTIGRAGKHLFSPLTAGPKSIANKNYIDDNIDGSENEPLSIQSDFRTNLTSNEILSPAWKNVEFSPRDKSKGPTVSSTTKVKQRGPGSNGYNNIMNDISGDYDDNDKYNNPVLQQSQSSIITPRDGSKRSPRAGTVTTNDQTTSYENGGSGGKFKLTHSASENSTKSIGANQQSTSQRLSPIPIPSPVPYAVNPVDREKEELLAALEVMKMQNKMLTTRIERSQMDTLTQIENEKLQRKQLVAKYEQENMFLRNQLNDAKNIAETQLLQEKEAFMNKIKEIEFEKESLNEKLEKIEVNSENEARLLRMQRSEMIDSITKLETDKRELEAKLIANKESHLELERHNQTLHNQHSDTSAEAVENALKLQKERDELQQILYKLEQDKNMLSVTLQETEQKVSQVEVNFKAQLENEKSQMNAQIQSMEMEKMTLFQQLKTTEQLAYEHNQAMQAQIEREHEMTQQAIESLERDKQRLMEQIQTNENSIKLNVRRSSHSLNGDSKNSDNSTSNSARRNSAGRNTTSTSPRRSANTSPLPSNALQINTAEDNEGETNSYSALLAEKQRMLAALNDISAEKEILKQKLLEKKQAQSAQELQKQLHVKLQLKRSVLKMKDELDSGRRRAGSVSENHSASRRGSGERAVVDIPALDYNAPGKTPTNGGCGSKQNSAGHSATNSAPLTPQSSRRKITISPKKSLYDVLESGSNAGNGAGGYDILSTSGNSGSVNNSTSNTSAPNMYHKIHLTRRVGGPPHSTFKPTDSRIDEEVAENGKNFMDIDSDDESTMGKSIKHSSAAKPSDALAQKEQTMEEIEEEMIANLPAPHSAAAMGNMKRIHMLFELDVELLKSLDSCGRKPMFYAAAYGRVEALRFLIENYLDTVLDGDIHFDTALHAATSSGNAECADILIQAAGGSKEAAEPRNSLEMTPAHLASTAECLEVLYKYEADICALDSHQRSPLFVACAMNREDCTEYLVNCLDHTESLLLLKDKRGDTPLHAAACNGSIECLLLLLQYGIDPRMVNDLGLKAIDLAVRNGHQKCRDVLAEYHLHYCTSSEFDSVLFLATLEGHKMIGQQTADLNATGANIDNSYQIIRKNSAQSLSLSPFKTTMAPGVGSPERTAYMEKAAQSMFSLRATKSLRLERWGAWIAYHDQTSNTVFWYNHEANQGQWNKPEQVTLMQLNSREKKDIFEKTLQAKASMRLTKIGDWIKYVTESGKIFFYNEKTNDFQWDDPVGTGHSATTSSTGGSHPGQGHRTSGASSDQDTSGGTGHSGNGSSAQSVEGDHGTADQGVEGSGDDSNPWRPYLDAESDSIFWYNHVTHVSQWECPYDNSTAAAKNNTANNSGDCIVNSDGTVSYASGHNGHHNSHNGGNGGHTKRGVKRNSFDDGELHEVIQVNSDLDLGI